MQCTAWRAGDAERVEQRATRRRERPQREPVPQPESDHGADRRRRSHRAHSNARSPIRESVIARKEIGPADRLKGIWSATRLTRRSAPIPRSASRG